jgi:hypothetical protein
MSTGAILQIAGTAIGGYLGGPLGAAIGGYLGSTFGPTTEIAGPRLEDLRVIGSRYGDPIPLVFGEFNRVSGNLIWSTGLIEKKSKKKSGGKGGGGGVTRTSYTYSTSIAIAISEGPCINIHRIWANGKILWDITTRDAPAPNGQEWVLETGGLGLPDGPLGYLSFHPGTATQNPDTRIEADLGAGNAPAYRNTCYIVLGDLELADFGNGVPNIEIELNGISKKTVGSVLRDICQRSGMSVDEYTVRTQLDALTLSGYVVATADNSMSAIAPLQAAFAFDTAEQSGEVRFVPRASMPVATIPRTIMASQQRKGDISAQPRYTLERLPDHDLLREASLTYRDKERDYQENTQRASRLFGLAHTKREETLAITFDTDEARRVVDRLLWGGWVDRVPAAVSLSSKYDFIRAGDVVMLQVSDIYVPFRVENRTRGVNGVIELNLRMEDPHIYTGSLAGQIAAIPEKRSRLVGDTFVLAFNAPILSTDHPDTGFSWAMDAESTGWRGGFIYRSIDGGSSYSEAAASNERNITGTVAAALPAVTLPDLWDRQNTITVTLRHADHELETLPEEDLLVGKNAAWLGAADGSRGEIIQFATATLISASPRVYELSNLLRGRRATEHEISLHGSNEIFVYFESDLMHSLDYGQSDWDRVRSIKGVSVFQAVEDVAAQTFTNLGERAKPRAPINGIGERDPPNNLTITWTARVRGFQLGLGFGALQMDDPDEWEIDIFKGAAIVRTISASEQSAEYTAAQQSADTLTPGAPVVLRIYQLSATRGRGHAGRFTV